MQLENQIALITGAGSGLGAATAAHFAALGAKVAILDFDLERANAEASKIDGFAVKADVSDQSQVENAFDEVIAHYGAAPRIIVSCAGVGTAARIVGRGGILAFDAFDQAIKVNLYGAYNVMSHGARHLFEKDELEDGSRGVIINTSSVAFEDGQIGQAAYAASKGGIASMTLPAAREFAQFGVRVMAIAPGLFHTPMMEGLPEEVAQKIISNIPYPHRLGTPNEFALLAQQIVENPYLNGSVVRLDGAVRLPPK